MQNVLRTPVEIVFFEVAKIATVPAGEKASSRGKCAAALPICDG
jgi:hypothetical protein